MFWIRITNKHLAGPKQYLSGKAHPTVFEGRGVDALKLVQLAHAIALDDIPPMVQLKVVREGVSIRDVDYFEPGRTERLADNACVS